jgi:hypothetical protein
MDILEFPKLNKNVGKDGAYEIPEFKLVNTSYATEVGRYFRKHGQYPYPPPRPKDDKDVNYYKRFQESRYWDNYKAFWDEEENRRRNGIVLPGAIVDGKLQKIHITGHHYSYLNYSVIPHEGGESTEGIIKGKKEHAKRVGKPKLLTPDFWDGDYYYFKSVELAGKLGLNLIVDKTRQVGYSFKGGSIASDEYDLYPGTTALLGAYDDKYLTKGGGLFNMAKDRINFLNAHTDWRKTISGTGLGSSHEIKSEYVYRRTKTKGGFRSRVIAVTFAKDTGAARGKKPTIILFDECGKWPNLRESLTATIKGLKEGSIVTGKIIIFGTGGGKKPENYADFEYIFYNPEEFNCLPFVNIWDDNQDHTVCGFFHPRYLNLKPYYDEHGNSDIVSAKANIERDRQVWRDTGKHDLYKENIAEEPIKPSESFDASSDNLFTTPELIEWKNRLSRDTDLDIGHHGLIVMDNGKLVFKDNNRLPEELIHPPILDIVKKGGVDLDGCVTIYDFPYKDDYNNVPDKLYYIVHDPFAIAKDKDEITYKHSLGAAYVYMSTNNFTPCKGDRLVAKYMGRPISPDIYNEQLFKLAEYYNATNTQLWYESDRGSEVLNYAKRFKKLAYLNYESNVDDNKEADNKKIRKYGINLGSLNRKLAAIQYLRDWLYRVRVDNNGEKTYNFHLIYDIRLIKELLRWNLEGNFDGVSAMLILSFLEKQIMVTGTYSNRDSLKDDNVLNLDNFIENNS